MYKVLFSRNFQDNLRVFLLNLKTYYFNLYTDTGIESEDAILANYNESFDALVSLVRQQIELMWKSWLLWRKIIQVQWNEESTSNDFYIRSYRVEFRSRKNNATKTIFVESVKITT